MLSEISLLAQQNLENGRTGWDVKMPLLINAGSILTMDRMVQ
jgi:hypothetical protein